MFRQNCGPERLEIWANCLHISLITCHFFWLLPLDGFYFIFMRRVYCVTVKTKNLEHHKTLFLVFFFFTKTITEKIEFFILSKSLGFQVAG